MQIQYGMQTHYFIIFQFIIYMMKTENDRLFTVCLVYLEHITIYLFKLAFEMIMTYCDVKKGYMYIEADVHPLQGCQKA